MKERLKEMDDLNEVKDMVGVSVEANTVCGYWR
jgi:hypothetical protein